MAKKPYTNTDKEHALDPIPELDLPPWLERLILVASKLAISYWLPTNGGRIHQRTHEDQEG